MTQLAKNQLHTVTVTGYTAEGLGVARINGQVVFIHGGVRGEACVVRVLKVLKNVAFCRVEEVLERSPARREPDCPHYPACGGCDFRHISYEEELEAKRQRVEDSLRRVGGADVAVEEILGSGAVDGYRNKVQFPVSPEGQAGFYRARSHQVIPALDCRLQAPQASVIAKAVEGYLREFDVPAYDEKTRRGLLRHIYVRTNREGQSLVCLTVNGDRLPHEEQLVRRLQEACPQTVGVVLNINTRDTNVVLGESYRTLWGEDTLTDVLCGLTFRLSVPSFYQVNRDQAERLYGKAIEFAGLTGKETVLDLYCGAGTITLAVARQAGRVIGAEIVPEAIENARENARTNRVENAEFFCGDAGAVAKKLAAEHLRPDVVVVDPPRKGLGEEVIPVIASMRPERVVYVSCDPGTLSRDVKRFAERDYRAVRAAAVDMFPRTRHVETCVLLRDQRSTRNYVYVDYAPESAEYMDKVPPHATYPEIKAWVLEHHGLKASSLYISQVKRKHGLPVGESYNKPKTEDAKKAAEGRWNGGQAPIGYRIDKERGVLVVEPEEAEMVKLVFGRYLDYGEGCQRIARWMNDHGYRRTVRDGENGKYELFTTHIVRHILDNPVYAGKIAYGRRSREKVEGSRNETRMVKQSEYMLVPGKHEAIISEADWARACVRRGETGGANPKTHSLDHEHILSGLLRCPMCGAPMYGSVNRKKKKDGTFYKDSWYYVCKHRKSATGQDCDYRRQPPQGPIDDEVVAMVSAAIRSPSFIEKMRDEMDTRTDEETIRTELAALRKARTQYVGAKDKLADRMDSLDVLDPAYDAKYADMERRLDALYLKISETEDDILLAEHDLARANDARVSLQAACELLERRADDLPSMPDAMKKECIGSFVESVDIYPEKQPDGRWVRNVRFRFPVMLDGEHEGRNWSRDVGHDETVCLLTRMK